MIYGYNQTIYKKMYWAALPACIVWEHTRTNRKETRG